MPIVRLNAAKGSGYNVISDRFATKVAWFVFLRDAVSYAQNYSDGDAILYDETSQKDVDFLYQPETIGAA